MLQHPSAHIRNRLLAALAPADYAALEPMLERVSLDFRATLIGANEPIRSVIFPESGLVSAIADIEGERIEVGVIGREGFVGVPAVLGTDQTPNTYIVQAPGEGLRIAPRDLRAAIAERPSLFRPLGLYVQSLIVQIAQTAYVNATFGIEARLARWLLMMQDRVEGDELPITHELLATLLGVRRPGVTIATHVLEGTGAIRARRGRIVVRDREKLVELAGDAYRIPQREYERLRSEVRAVS